MSRGCELEATLDFHAGRVENYGDTLRGLSVHSVIQVLSVLY